MSGVRNARERYDVSRRLGIPAVATSLLFCAAVVALWILSWRQPYCLTFEREAASTGVFLRNSDTQVAASFYSMRGEVDVRYYRRTGTNVPAGPWQRSLSPVANPQPLCERPVQPTIGQRLGFYSDSGTPQGSYFAPKSAGEKSHFVFVGLPYWALAVLTALIPGWWGSRRWRNPRKQRAGSCRACGYSLMGNVSGVCPECGKSTGGIMPGGIR